MKSVVAHGALALVALTVAYMVWTKAEEPETTSDDQVTIVDCSTDELTSLTLHTKQRDVKLEMRGRGDERATWFHVTRRATPPATAPDPASAATSTPPAPDDVKTFAGSNAATDYLAKVIPFRALRSLGTVNQAQLEEIELKTPETTLEVSCGGRPRTFQIGGTTFGTGDRYAREATGGPVFLLSADIVRDLESAEFRLMQRDLHTFEMNTVGSIRVQALDRERTLLQRGRENQEQNTLDRWVDAAEPTQRNELYGNWLERVGRLRVQDYLAPDAEPGSEQGAAASGGGTPTPVLRLTYLDEGGDEIGRLELVQVAGASPGATEYYARSEATHGWVKVLRSIAEEVEHDVRPVVGLEALPDAPTPPTSSEPTTPSTPGAAVAPTAPGTPRTAAPLPAGHPAVPLPVPPPTIPTGIRNRPADPHADHGH